VVFRQIYKLLLTSCEKFFFTNWLYPYVANRVLNTGKRQLLPHHVPVFVNGTTDIGAIKYTDLNEPNQTTRTPVPYFFGFGVPSRGPR
jgi:hypothetical protein